jgi:dienelactone hydrolase
MPRDLSLQFWDLERLLVQRPDRWEVRSWPDWRLLQAGEGTAATEPGGGRLAVATPDGTIAVNGSGPVGLPAGAGMVVAVAWAGGSLVVAARQVRSPHPAAVTAWEFAARPSERTSIWRVPLDGTEPIRLWDTPLGMRVWALKHLAGEVLVECYPYGDLRRPPTAPRLVVVTADGRVHDLAPELPGACCDAAVAPDKRVAFLHGAFTGSELLAPVWFTLVQGQPGRWRTLLAPERCWGPPAWAVDGSRLILTGLQGIRRGVATVDPATGRWAWVALEPDASYRTPALAPLDGDVVAVRQPLDGDPEIVAVRGRNRRVLQALGNSDPESAVACCRWRVHGWQGPDGALEGILATPAGTGGGPWPLVVDLHGGPQGGLVAGDPTHRDHLSTWCTHGFAAFAPDFRGSGILGLEPMLAALRGEGLPDHDREAGDVLSGVESLVATGVADPDRLFLFGHSYGGYLVNRIVTIDHRFRAAVCWEGVADLRLLDALLGGNARQRALLGGSPWQAPERWAAASPATRADRVRTPILLLYGQDGIGPAHGVAWFTALQDHRVPCSLVVYDGEGHLFTRPENQADTFARSAGWFRRHQTRPQ